MSNTHKVTTDALDTLGTIITEGHRDAIHLAVEPIEAGESLAPGNHIGIIDGKAYGEFPGRSIKLLGIVDPFIKHNLKSGDKFWLIVYPRTITSLRHVWEHPDFNSPEPKQPEITDPHAISWAWIDDFAAQIDQTRNRLMDAADDWVNGGEYTYDNSESYKDHWDKFDEFWIHYQIVRGKTVEDKGHFFTCSC